MKSLSKSSYLISTIVLFQAHTLSFSFAAAYSNLFMESCKNGKTYSLPTGQKLATATSCKRLDQTDNNGNLIITCSPANNTAMLTSSGVSNPDTINTAAKNNIVNSSGYYGRNSMIGGFYRGYWGGSYNNYYNGGYINNSSSTSGYTANTNYPTTTNNNTNNTDYIPIFNRNGNLSCS